VAPSVTYLSLNVICTCESVDYEFYDVVSKKITFTLNQKLIYRIGPKVQRPSVWIFYGTFMVFAKRERKREEILFGRKWILTWVWHTVN
jgi:hypothetical protein